MLKVFFLSLSWTGAAILITSKKFDPAAYLSIVHPNATYHDLVTGIANLENAIEARSEAVRILVEDQFDKFASVKATIEGMYALSILVLSLRIQFPWKVCMKTWNPVYFLTELTTALSRCGTTLNVSFHCFQSFFSNDYLHSRRRAESQPNLSSRARKCFKGTEATRHVINLWTV